MENPLKLFYKPGACSLASHIVLREVGGSFTLEQVDTDAHRTASGADYASINPKGYVPALDFGGDGILTEGAAILQFIADRHPEKALAPAAGTLARARLHEALNHLSSELHKAFGPFFSGQPLSAEARGAAENRLFSRLDHIEAALADGRAYLLGEVFSVADAYLFAIGRWVGAIGYDYARWPRIGALLARVESRPTTQAAMRAEGLI
jgi:glutathione S-transferase